MRLIDADEIKKSLYIDTTGWEPGGTHPKIVEEEDIDNCQTIDAIPVSWIEEYRDGCYERSLYESEKTEDYSAIQMMLDDWKESEKAK